MANLKSLSINNNNLTNFILEEKSSSSNTSNIKYRKWYDGTLELWYTVAITLNYTKIWYNVVYDEYKFNTPSNVPSFITVDHIQQSLYGYTGGGLYGICPTTNLGINADGTVCIDNYIYSLTSDQQSNKNIGISNYLVGTWK